MWNTTDSAEGTLVDQTGLLGWDTSYKKGWESLC